MRRIAKPLPVASVAFLSWLEHLDRHLYELCQTRCTRLCHDERAVGFNRSRADPEALAYFLVGQTVDEQFHDLPLPIGKVGQTVGQSRYFFFFRRLLAPGR